MFYVWFFVVNPNNILVHFNLYIGTKHILKFMNLFNIYSKNWAIKQEFKERV